MLRIQSGIIMNHVVKILLLSLVLPATAVGQDLSSADIIKKLQNPKPFTEGTRSLSLSGSKDNDQAAFLRSLPTRGITVGDRKRLDQLFSYKQLPALDIQINFEKNSARIMQNSKPDLKALGIALKHKSLSHFRVALSGHTDASGPAEYNQKLSEERAASVRKYLIDNFKVNPERLVSIGFGEERLKNKVKPRAKENRRVEVINLSVKLVIIAN